MGKIVIGIGINIENELPEPIENIATRLIDHVPEDSGIDIYQIASEVALEIIKTLDKLDLLEN